MLYAEVNADGCKTSVVVLVTNAWGVYNKVELLYRSTEASWRLGTTRTNNLKFY